MKEETTQSDDKSYRTPATLINPGDVSPGLSSDMI